MSRINTRISKLRKAPQAPLSHAGAAADADRAKRPPLVPSPAPDSELNLGDRVESLANFGKPRRRACKVGRRRSYETGPALA